ncbi:unnamed protein product [Acanthoscelides obtectus]|uniref:Uncharacterized protein n=1 Tax=Acanthoscelides obtectus TaxID=200917 RepID=A0A9P0KXS8_ACAOB|nr:unnamed protein product [Acanthoscelides obtectus]CAK1649502.1 hypothetical protein AOBTE_LOCUS16278 [Acanthoscelides obtectus]
MSLLSESNGIKRHRLLSAPPTHSQQAGGYSTVEYLVQFSSVTTDNGAKAELIESYEESIRIICDNWCLISYRRYSLKAQYKHQGKY